LNDQRHFDDVTSDDKLLQQWNAQSPIVDILVSGTTSAEVDDERRDALSTRKSS